MNEKHGTNANVLFSMSMVHVTAAIIFELDFETWRNELTIRKVWIFPSDDFAVGLSEIWRKVNNNTLSENKDDPRGFFVTIFDFILSKVDALLFFTPVQSVSSAV